MIAIDFKRKYGFLNICFLTGHFIDLHYWYQYQLLINMTHTLTSFTNSDCSFHQL